MNVLTLSTYSTTQEEAAQEEISLATIVCRWLKVMWSIDAFGVVQYTEYVDIFHLESRIYICTIRPIRVYCAPHALDINAGWSIEAADPEFFDKLYKLIDCKLKKICKWK